MLRERFYDIYYAIIHFRLLSEIISFNRYHDILKQFEKEEKKNIIKYSIIDNYNFRLI